MKNADYEYIPDLEDEEEIDIGPDREDEIIKKLRDKIVRGHIALYQILDIGNNNQEINFAYKWLAQNGTKINGVNGTLSGELLNYNHIPKVRQSIMPRNRIPREKQGEYFEKIEQGDANARNEFIEGNWRLAAWVANWNVFNKLNIPLKDKNQMALIGLMNAVDTFNYRQGFAFSTYAVKVIFGSILNQYRDEHEFSGKIFEKLKEIEKLEEIENNHIMTTGKEATDEEIANEIGVSIEIVKEIKYNREKFISSLSFESLLDRDDEQTREKTILNIDETARGVNTEGGYIVDGVYLEEDDSIPLDEDEKKIIDTDLEGEGGILKDITRKLVGTLTEREQKVIILRFGLDGEGSKPLYKVGNRLNLTKERVRQIEAKALRKLRYQSKPEKLKEFIEDSTYEPTIQGYEAYYTGLDSTIGRGNLKEELIAREQRRRKETDLSRKEIPDVVKENDLKDKKVEDVSDNLTEPDRELSDKIQETRDLLKELDEINAELIKVITNINDENVKKLEMRKLRERRTKIIEEQQN